MLAMTLPRTSFKLISIINYATNNIINKDNCATYLCVVACLILAADNAPEKDQVNYFLALPDNKSIHMHVYTSDELNVTQCDNFEVPAITFICDGAAHTLDIKMAIEAGIVEKRMEACLESKKDLFYSGVLIAEGLLDEKEANRLGVSNMKYWKRAFRRLNSKYITNKVVTLEHQTLYEWVKINYLKKVLGTKKDFGFMKWMKEGVQIVYAIRDEEGTNSVGCIGYDITEIHVKDAGLDYLDDFVRNFVIESFKRNDSGIIENPCGRLGELMVANSYSINGTGNYTACTKLMKSLFSSRSVWKIDDMKYKGPNLIGLEAITSLFRSLSQGQVISKENLTREGVRACTASRSELLFEWISCTRLAFIDYIIYTKYAMNATHTHIVAPVSIEESHLIKKTKWLVGFIVMDYSSRHENRCCSYRQETRGHALLPNYKFTFLFVIVSSLFCIRLEI